MENFLHCYKFRFINVYLMIIYSIDSLYLCIYKGHSISLILTDSFGTAENAEQLIKDQVLYNQISRQLTFWASSH